MSPTSTSRPIALVTGASAGLGAAYAERLARDGHDVVLVARRVERLQALQARLEREYQARSLVVPLDLTTPQAATRLYETVQQAGWAVDVLVSNAGFGYYGPFLEQDPTDIARMCQINVTFVAELASLFGRDMAARGRGRVIHIASGAGFFPTPYFALYGATKAFAMSFSQALSAELEERGVQVLCVCPGATATEFHGVAAGEQGANSKVIPGIMSVDAVVNETFRALEQGKWLVVPGFKNALQVQLPRRLFPARLAARIAMGKMKSRLEALRETNLAQA